MGARSERTGFLVLALLAFVYVLLRAVLVPLTHDEAATFQTYVLTGRYLPFLSHWDAGNHLLITAVGRACYNFFGPGPLSLRSFSVLCFALQAWYTWRITRSLHHHVVRWCALAALLLTPFALDFYSMFRGYGPSLAFLLMAVFHLERYAQRAGKKHLAIMLLALALGSYASLSLLVLWCLFLAMALTLVLRADRTDVRAWAMLLLFGGLPLWFAAQYSMALAERDLLYFGTHDGFVQGTLGSLAQWVLGVHRPLLGAFFWLLGLAAGAYAFYRSKATVLGVLLVLIMGEWIGRLVLGEALGILYPQDRTALHLVPLFVLVFAFAVEGIATLHAKAKWVALFLLWLPLRTLSHANLDSTLYWPEQAIPQRVFELAEERQHAKDRPLLIGGYRQNPRTWIYHAALRTSLPDRPGGALNFLDDAGFPQPTCDLLIIDTTHFLAPEGFRTLYTASHGRLVLMERILPLRTEVRRDSTWSVNKTEEEYVPLWSPEGASVHGKEWLIEVDGSVISANDPLELRLVIEAKDAEGNQLHYDVIDIEDQLAVWNGDRLHILRRLPAFADEPARVVAFFWNPRKQSFAMERLRIVVHEVLVDGFSGQ